MSRAGRRRARAVLAVSPPPPVLPAGGVCVDVVPSPDPRFDTLWTSNGGNNTPFSITQPENRFYNAGGARALGRGRSRLMWRAAPVAVTLPVCPRQGATHARPSLAQRNPMAHPAAAPG